MGPADVLGGLTREVNAGVGRGQEVFLGQHFIRLVPGPNVRSPPMGTLGSTNGVRHSGRHRAGVGDG